jgi:hypothetical protein
MKKHEECFAASRLMLGRVDRLSTEPLGYVSSSTVYFFFGPNLGAPISLPLNLMPRTLSMLARIFWSGAAVPLSKSATMLAVVLHLVARSFWVILGSIFWRRSEMTAPTSLPTVVGLTISSERSTLVRCWPSTPGFEAWVSSSTG